MQVFKGVCDGVHDVAIKVSEAEGSTEALMTEFSILRHCRHSNIVQVCGLISWQLHFLLVSLIEFQKRYVRWKQDQHHYGIIPWPSLLFAGP